MTEQSPDRAATLEMPDDIDAINRLYRERRWGDGLPIVPPTAARVERMLAYSRRGRHELVARVAPGFGAATVERLIPVDADPTAVHAPATWIAARHDPEGVQ
jgi:hypothetical protein